MKRKRRMNDLLDRQPLASSIVPDKPAYNPNLQSRGTHEGKSDENSTKYVNIDGRAIFCLHDIGCEWWQGHFLRKRNDETCSSSHENTCHSLGLLCTLREMDDCMVCSDGGYRELDTKIIRFHKMKSLSVPCMSTGGDMLRIRSDMALDSNTKLADEDKMIAFDAEQVLTGNDAIPYLRKFFKKLIRKISSDDAFLRDDDLLDLLPDVAIVIGDMSICIENSFLYQS